MSTTGDIGGRLDRIERTLRELQAELAEIREAAGPSVPESPAAPPSPSPVEPLTVAAAWHALERGRDLEAVTHAEAAFARASRTGDDGELAGVTAFAAAARAHVQDPQLDARLAALRAPERRAAVPPPAPARAPVPPPAPRPAEPPAPEPQRRVRPAAGRVRAWAARELTGSRLFALGGGALMLLGVVFLFVVAANRGWVGPRERVLIGAAASLAVLVVGLALRRRYGRLQASLAAVGVGIGGAYATLAAATLIYGYLPQWGALLVAAGIATLGGAIAVAWSSQIIAGLALVGAAAAPGLVALDDGIEASAPAFALIVLAAAIAVAASRRWLWLVAVVGATALPQVVWLVADSAPRDGGAIAVAAAASLVLLAGALAWQATAADDGLDPASGTMALLGAGLALWPARTLLPDDQEAGVALAAAAGVYGAVAVAAGRRWRDLGWVVGAAALLLAGVSTAALLSGRALGIVLAVEAVVLAGLGRRLPAARFTFGALVYLGLGVGHAAVVELAGAVEAGDVPRSASAALFALAAASLAVGLLLPSRRGDAPSTGVLAPLEPLWDGLVRERASIRALLGGLAVALASAGLAGLASGRWLTILYAAAGALLGLAARAARERRLLAVALPLLVLATSHALATEVPPSTLWLARGADPVEPIPSLVALAAAAAVLALTCRFEQRGLTLLGPLEGPELELSALDERGAAVRSGLVQAAAAFAAWALGLALVDVSYEWGQVGATSLWAVLGAAATARGAAVRSWAAVAAGVAVLGGAYLKSVAFDWRELDAAAGATSLLVVAAALLAAGFLARWLDVQAADEREALSILAGAVAAGSAVAALEHAGSGGDLFLGAGTLVVTAALAGVAAPPYRRWRSKGGPPWARTLADGYGALALATLLLAESALAGFGVTHTLIAWAATAAVLAACWRPLAEPRVWLAATALTATATAGAVALVTPPERLVVAGAHPGHGLSALLTCLVAAVAVTTAVPAFATRWRAPLAAGTAGVGLYLLSLTVLEAAERVSGASIETDFQRGHTALSTLLGLGALGVYVVGLARDQRSLRVAGLTLFGLALAKLFLYDLRSLSSITRALSFLALGAVLLAAAFFAERAVRRERDDGPGSSVDGGEPVP